MKKTLKQIFAGFLSFALIITTMLSLGVNSVFAETSGQCTNTIDWSYDIATRTLSITGKGVMPDYRMTDGTANLNQAPWEKNTVDNTKIKELVENLVVGEGITEIGEYCFFNCVNLTSVSLPSTLKSIDGQGLGTDLASASYGAFQNCTSLEEITLPDKLQTIEPYAFKNCSSLKSITFPASLTSLGKCAFLNCSSLESVNFSTGLTETGENTFDSCNVKRVNWGSITKVSAHSFDHCGFKYLVLPETITSIEDRSFANNTSLMSVTVNNASMAFNGNRSTGISSLRKNNFMGSEQTVTIIGHSASTAKTFAQEFGYDFSSMDNCDHEDTRTEMLIEATCTEPGVQEKICNSCGFSFGETEVEALGHDYEQVGDDIDCTEIDGHIYRHFKCSRCGDTMDEVEHQRDSKGALIWIEGNYEVSNYRAPSCTRTGSATYTCTVDGCTNLLGVQTTGVVYFPKSHTVENWTVTAATCTKDGSRTGVCTTCGERVTEEIPATGHKYTEADLVNPDEEPEEQEDGHTYKHYTCQNCGEDVAVPEHIDWVDGCYTRIQRDSPTCTIPGVALDTCDICGKTRIETIPATGNHEYEEVSRTEPTCTAPGYINYECKNCDMKWVETIDKLDHDYVLDSRTEPTCTTNGREVYVCSRCGGADEVTLDALGHTPDETNYEVTQESTCEKTGKAYTVCTVCGEEFFDTIPALGHDYIETERDLTDEGKPGHVMLSYQCSRCNSRLSDKMAHREWVEGKYTTTTGSSVATCTAIRVYDTCDIDGCSARRERDLPGIGHMYFYVSQSYEGVTLMCRHCATSTVIPAATLQEYWDELAPVNVEPNRTATDNTGYLDFDGNGIINAKDFARIVRAAKKESELIAAHNAKMAEDYIRDYEDGGELTLGKEGKTVTVEDNDGVITPGYVFTFTPEESGDYEFYSSTVVDTSSEEDESSSVGFDTSILDGLDVSQINIDTDGAAAAFDTMAFLTVEGDDTWSAYDDNSGSLYNFKITFTCEEGVTYYLSTGFNDTAATGSYKVAVIKAGTAEDKYSRTYEEGGSISTGNYTGKEVEITDGEGYDFTFTPTQSGTYRFYSASTAKTYAYFEEDGAETWQLYAESETASSFTFTADCERGKTYHIKTGFSDEEQTGSYRIFVVSTLQS